MNNVKIKSTITTGTNTSEILLIWSTTKTTTTIVLKY